MTRTVKINFDAVHCDWRHLKSTGKGWGARFRELGGSEKEAAMLVERLRKWCLIRAGFRDERTFVARTSEEALRLAAYIKPMDAYAVVIVRGNTVTHCTAKSQSLKAMGKAEFQKSKDAVLALLARLIGTDVADLRNAKAA